MKRLRILLAGIAVFVAVLMALVWWLPARWALPLLQPRLHGLQWQAVSGTVWAGRAGQVSLAGGTPLGALDWSLSRGALLGRIDVEIGLRQASFRFHGYMHQLSSTQQVWRDVTVSLDPALLAPQPWLHAKPLGELQLNMAHAMLQGGWPMQAEATAHWQQAAVQTEHGIATLGGMAAQISVDNGVLNATLSDEGDGALHMSGALSFSPLGWNLQLSLKPRRPDPILAQWLRSLGRPAADGTLQLGYRGGLAQINHPGAP